MSALIDVAAIDLLRRIRLNSRNERLLNLALGKCTGTADEVSAKIDQAHNLLALSQASERVAVYTISLKTDLEALCLLTIDPTKYLELKDTESLNVNILTRLKVKFSSRDEKPYQLNVVSPTIAKHPYVEDLVNQELKLPEQNNEPTSLLNLLIASFATLSSPMSNEEKKDPLEIAAMEWWSNSNTVKPKPPAAKGFARNLFRFKTS